MDTTPLIQATVGRIVALKQGDVYKRLADKDRYGRAADEPAMRFGIVTDVLNNGSEAAITAIEFDVTYRTELEVKVFRAGTDVAFFAATPAEVTAHLSEVLRHARSGVEEAERELGKRRGVLALVSQAFNDRGVLTAPETSTQITTTSADAVEPATEA